LSHCAGTGKISSTLLLEDEIEKNLKLLLTHQHKDLVLVVHPIMLRLPDQRRMAVPLTTMEMENEIRPEDQIKEKYQLPPHGIPFL